MRVSPVAAATLQTKAQSTQTTSLSQDFMTLLIAQLQAQDPLEPMDASDFMSQLAQLQSVSELSTMNLQLMQLLDLESLDPTLSLIGREVQWIDPGTGERASGIVDRVELTSDRGYVLVVGDEELSLDQVLSVGLADNRLKPAA